jgi:hypothetical protein
MEDLVRLLGEERDLKQLAHSFSTGPARIEKREEWYFLVLESAGARRDDEVLADGRKKLAEMNAIVLMGDANFRPPTVHGISKKCPDGSMSHVVDLGTVNMQARFGIFPSPTLIVQNANGTVTERGPTEDQIALGLASKCEPFQRALFMYGSSTHDWDNLFNVLEAIEDGNGGETGLIAKQFVKNRLIKDFKSTVNSFRALGLKARHGTTTMGIEAAKMSLNEAQEMIRNLFRGWKKELQRESASSS